MRPWHQLWHWQGRHPAHCRQSVKASGGTFEALCCSDMGQHREQMLLVQDLGAPAHPAGVPRRADSVRCAALRLSNSPLLRPAVRSVCRAARRCTQRHALKWQVPAPKYGCKEMLKQLRDYVRHWQEADTRKKAHRKVSVMA